MRIRPKIAMLLVLIIQGVYLAQGQTDSSRASEPPTAGLAGSAGGRAAILHQPGMPIKGAASSPETIAKILDRAGIKSQLLSADQLADPAVLNTKSFDLLVLPSGESFPSKARDSLVRFLRDGGNLITTGGYAFNNLLVRENGQWRSEADVCRERLAEATRKENSLLRNGDFEAARDFPEPGKSAPDQWQRTSTRCTIVQESLKEGASCAKVAVLPTDADKGPVFWQDVAAKPGNTYRISGWMRSDKVLETGMAYIALYQYDSEGKLVTFLDFARARGTTEWTYHTYTVKADARTARLQVKVGLYQTHGTAWFDDIRLADVTSAQVKPMNTSTGKPMDGLVVSPEQIGMFDASFPLKRVAGIRAAGHQHLFPIEIIASRPLAGWAASGVIGSDNARWVPLLDATDRYGRPRGAAGAMLLHYNGHYAGSCWAYFGIDNTDLFADAQGRMADGLATTARFMLRKVFLRNLSTDHRSYRPGEQGSASVFVDNRSTVEHRVRLTTVIDRPGRGSQEAGSQPLIRREQDVTVAPEKTERISIAFTVPDAAQDLYEVGVSLASAQPGDKPAVFDDMNAGFVVDHPETIKAGPELRFKDNYFTLNGRPAFLFGTDTYAYTYNSSYSNPLTWDADMHACVDIGLNLYENLNFVHPTYELTDDDWRSFRAMGQLTQKHGLIYMPGMLIGHNVAIGDDLLARQSSLCGQYALRFKDLPGLLYYINGDYQMMLGQHPKEVEALWNRWLKDRYGTTDRLREAWRPTSLPAELGKLAFWPPDSGKWEDAAIVDRLRFQNWLTRRWNEAHVAAIRAQDALHPITSEYYQICWGGMDLIQTIDGQDVSNFGYFATLGKDTEILPLKIRFNDLRARGKGVCLGEYGVKTHPAWTVENGATDYHVTRTEEQQIQLFMAVAHYGLGMGAAKVQNWCLQDAQDSVFPWGLFYPNQLIPKDVAYVHRNQSIIWRHFAPKYVPPKLTVCIPNNLRLGNFEAVGREVADRAFETLLGLHYDFNVIDDHHLDRLPKETRVMIYPSPFAASDDAYDRLLGWVRDGGTLLITGDFSYDENRQRTRTKRLSELAGVEFVAECYPNISRASALGSPASMAGLRVRPCIKVKPAGAEVLEETGEHGPVYVRNLPGKGRVFFYTDPTELAPDEQAAALRRRAYETFLTQTDARRLRVAPDEPWIHVMAQPTATGTVHVICNRKPEPGEEQVTVNTVAGDLTVNTRSGWPALAAVTNDGRILAVNAFGTASLGTQPLLRGKGLKAVLSLDGKDIRKSEALLIAPFEPGTISITPGEFMVAVAGEFREGRWTPLERIDVGKNAEDLVIGPDLATCLILVCRRDAEARWADHLSRAMLRPWEIEPGLPR